MARFTFAVTVPALPGAFEAAALGATAGAPLVSNDINKIVKLEAGSTDDNYIVAGNGDNIEGVLTSIEPNTVNSGFAFGTVQKRFIHMEARVVAGGTTLAVGNYVVAAAQNALGTAQDYPIVRLAAAEQFTAFPTTLREGSAFPWRVKSLIGGNGAAGSLVLIEPTTR